MEEFDELFAELRSSYDALHRQFQNKQREVAALDHEVKRLTAERDKINSQIRSARERLGLGV
jgi:predicted  nucleic acid-binding Zn-ribbon protein